LISLLIVDLDWVSNLTQCRRSASHRFGSNLLEPVSGKPGPGAYEPSEGYPVVTRVENIVVDQASELPRRACLVDGAASASAGTMSLTVEEDKRLLKLMPAE
jgi:hypothetical protein